ncbi:MAG: non-heme iron oxygenase ferredoxin subunit [Chromatiales bacterium]|nr:non-heme iron oxygenase ferredoxin subunit [Chromatiales bacterium]
MSNSWHTVAHTDELPPGQMKRVEINGQKILLAHAEGEIYAVDDTCSHEDFSLSYGCLDGDMIKCSLHGSRFSLKTGEPQEEPADEPINTYEVKLDNNNILVKL